MEIRGTERSLEKQALRFIAIQLERLEESA
jgi:hypothetical protein